MRKSWTKTFTNACAEGDYLLNKAKQTGSAFGFAHAASIPDEPAQSQRTV
jgi:hypothetical protein